MSRITSKKKKVAVGLSGGVDSAVSAFLLKKQEYEVTGVYFKCWNDISGCGLSGGKLAKEVADKLEIKFQELDFGDKFKDEVIQYFLNEYSGGKTPNPDIVCNEKVKFGAFYDWAIDHGYDYVATGHYVQTKNVRGETYLLKGRDKSKDQSYFLYKVPNERLSKVLFPVGSLTKNIVRSIAKANDISSANRPESFDVCFVGTSTLKKYLSKNIGTKEGEVLDLKGKVIGYHDGVWFFTIGQRKGFTIEKYVGEPMYVIGKNIKDNQLIVGPRDKCFRNKFSVSDISWTSYNPGKKFKCKVRIRHLGELYRCLVSEIEEGVYEVKSRKKIFGVASGQSAVFYQDKILVGGGVIQE